MSELEIIRHGQVHGVSVFFNTVEYRTPHFHPEWELVWITDGALLVRSGRGEERYETGELCLLPPKRIHAFCQADDRAVTFLCLQITPQVFSYVYPKLESLTTDAFRPGAYLPESAAEELRGCFRMLAEDYFSDKPCCELRCAEHCAHILRLLLTNLPMRPMSAAEIADADRRNERLDRFVRYVEENYAEKPSLAAFAQSEHCSESHMSRFLKANLNMRFQDYVAFVRFRSACRMIESGTARMIDVSEASGFSDYRYFSACFKKHCGMTPEEYSRKHPAVKNRPSRINAGSSERFYTREESLALLRSGKAGAAEGV